MSILPLSQDVETQLTSFTGHGSVILGTPESILNDCRRVRRVEEKEKIEKNADRGP
jgi:hypothetical protein